MFKFIIIGLLFYISSCKSITAKPKFSIYTPQGWVKKDTTFKDEKMTFLLGEQSNEAISIIGVHSINTDDYIKELISNTKSKCEYLDNLENGQVQLSGKKIKWIKYNAKFRMAEGSVEQVVFFIEKGIYVFSISCTAENNSLYKMKPIIDSVLSSFKFI